MAMHGEPGSSGPADPGHEPGRSRGFTGAEPPHLATAGSPERQGHVVAQPLLTFDLAGEVETLQREPSWTQGDRNARTLYKEHDARIVLTVLKAGATLQQHRAPGTVSVQVLSGYLRLGTQGDTVDLPAGLLLTMEPGLVHEVEALEDSAFLLTVAWPRTAGPA